MMYLACAQLYQVFIRITAVYLVQLYENMYENCYDLRQLLWLTAADVASSGRVTQVERWLLLEQNLNGCKVCSPVPESDHCAESLWSVCDAASHRSPVKQTDAVQDGERGRSRDQASQGSPSLASVTDSQAERDMQQQNMCHDPGPAAL